MAAGGQLALRAPGVCTAPPLWLWTLCSCYFFPWCQAVVSCFKLVALRAVWCRVCCFVSADPVRVGCFLLSPAVWGLVRGLPFLCCWSALVGQLSVLQCAVWGVLLLFALLQLFPLLRLFVTKAVQGPFCGQQAGAVVWIPFFGWAVPSRAHVLAVSTFMQVFVGPTHSFVMSIESSF